MSCVPKKEPRRKPGFFFALSRLLQRGEGGKLGEELIVLLEAGLGLVEEGLRLVGADHLHELAEAVLAEVLREGVGGEGD
ncbi:MAG: hypothetical protein IKJ37_08170, partial [Kiritimatiellae bacterium]|nr:hypothetical protein [Kiritimatiellia bacterium]